MQTTVASIRASLVVRGFGDDPVVVSNTLGLRPSHSGRYGDRLVGYFGQPSGKPVREAYWALRSRLDPIEPLQRHIQDILTQVEGADSLFTRLPQGTTSRLFCTVIPENGVPLLLIDSASLQKLGEMNVSLEIDVIEIEDPPDDTA